MARSLIRAQEILATTWVGTWYSAGSPPTRRDRSRYLARSIKVPTSSDIHRSEPFRSKLGSPQPYSGTKPITNFLSAGQTELLESRPRLRCLTPLATPRLRRPHMGH